MRITHIAPLSVGKIAFVLYGCLGLIACLLFIPMMIFGIAQGEHGFPTGAAFAIAVVVIGPVIYGAIGSLFAMAATVIYNVVAGMVGGVELTLDSSVTAAR